MAEEAPDGKPCAMTRRMILGSLCVYSTMYEGLHIFNLRVLEHTVHTELTNLLFNHT